MSSYQPQFINPGPSFASGLGNGISDGLSYYAKAALKNKLDEISKAKKEKEQQSNLDKFTSFAKSQGKEVKYGYGPNGLSASTENQKDPTMQDLEVGAVGALPANKYAQIGKNMGIEPESLTPAQTPNAAMSLIDGGMGDINANPIAPVQQDYGKTVMNALQSNPLVTNRGRSDRTPLPSNFANDFKVAHDSANGDADQFVKNLKDMSVNYYDNPKALVQIKKLIDLNKTKKKTGVSSLR